MNTQGALMFLINLVIDLYTYLVLTRLIMQVVRADFYNPISQFVVKATQPVLGPMRRVIPAIGRIDTASLVLVLALLMIKIALYLMVTNGSASAASPVDYLVVSIRMLVGLLLNYILYAIFLRVILSWVSPDPYNPLNRIVTQITEPVLGPARRLIPPIGMLDISAMLVIVAIYFLRILFNV